MKCFATFIGIFFTLICFATLQADIYTWTDEDGVKHYSNEPPDKDNVEVEFQEQQGNQPAVQQNQQPADSQQREMDKLIREIDADQKREEAEQRRKAKATFKKNLIQQGIPPKIADKIVEEYPNPINEIFSLIKNST